MLGIMYGNITYLTQKGSFKQVNDALPITQTIPDRDDPATFEARKKELATDLLKKAKQLEILIANLPSATEADARFDQDYEQLQQELSSVRTGYDNVLQSARALHFYTINLQRPS